jgi:hypothetical protein
LIVKQFFEADSQPPLNIWSDSSAERQIDVEIAAIGPIKRMGLQLKRHIQVTGPSAIKARAALAG